MDDDAGAELEIDDIAAQDLNERLEQITAEMRMLARGADGEINQFTELLHELAQRVAHLENAPPPHPPVRPWVERASQGDWEQLIAWVEWLTATYELGAAETPQTCWPQHLGVAEELAALWLAWQDAMTGQASGQDRLAAVGWHATHLPAVLERVTDRLRRCETGRGHRAGQAADRPGEETSLPAAP